MEQILIVIFSSFCGGLVQAVTGFGGAVIIMIFLPLILNMTAAPALSDVITMTLSFSMFWRYRKAVHYKSILIPAAVYLVTSTLAIHGSAYVDAGKLKGFFGVFLILLSVYFFAFSGKLSVKPTFFMKFGCGALAGICGGLFGISGPPASPSFTGWGTLSSGIDPSSTPKAIPTKIVTKLGWFSFLSELPNTSATCATAFAGPTMLLAAVIPLIVLHFFNKGTVVERLRTSE